MSGTRQPQDDAFPWAPALLASPLFEGMDETMRTAFVEELEWFTLPGGVTLYEENEPSDAFYIVVAGCLGGFLRTSAGTTEMVARVPTGETIGELDLLGGRPRAMTVVALRDTSLLRMTKMAFEKLSQRNPGAMLHLLTQFFAWLQWPRQPGTDLPIPRTVALVPLSPTVDGALLARSLTRQLRMHNISVSVLGRSRVETEAFYASEEAAHGLVIYVADGSDTNWTRLCLRRADRILLVADASQTPPQQPVAFFANTQRLHWRALEMALLQPPEEERQSSAAPWLDFYPVGFHCHIRSGDDRDIARLARYLTGRAVGVVLSGGGARAYGHIGVLRALRQARIPIDLVGGTSMGAIIAAGVAARWDDAEMSSRIRNAFVSSNPLDDYAFPLVALTRGRKVTRLLRENFGEVQIEDLWLPYFLTLARQGAVGMGHDLDRRLKLEFASSANGRHFLDEFWPVNDQETRFFQPEPGCSDPTFIGSAADVAILVGRMFNVVSGWLAEGVVNRSFGFGVHVPADPQRVARSPLEAEYSWTPDGVYVDPRNGYQIRVAPAAEASMLNWMRKSERQRGANVEAGGVLFGQFDDFLKIIWVTAASGPPPDSIASEIGFVCGTRGVSEMNREMAARSRASVAFVGMWHTHPGGNPDPSPTDRDEMAKLFASPAFRGRHFLMLIVGGLSKTPTIAGSLFDRDE